MRIDPGLAQRLELLERSGQIDGQIARFLETSLPRVANELGVTLTDDAFGTAATHTALALQRARKGEAIEEWSSEHAKELEEFPHAVACADDFARDAETQLGVTVPSKEREFLALHLASVALRAEPR